MVCVVASCFIVGFIPEGSQHRPQRNAAAGPGADVEAAAGQQYHDQWWPDPYLAGKAQLERNLMRGTT